MSEKVMTPEQARETLRLCSYDRHANKFYIFVGVGTSAHWEEPTISERAEIQQAIEVLRK